MNLPPPPGFFPANTLNTRGPSVTHLVKPIGSGPTGARLAATLCHRSVTVATAWPAESWPTLDQRCTRCTAAVSKRTDLVVETPRTLAHRIPHVVDREGIRHVAKPDAGGSTGSPWRDVTTACDILLPAGEGHENGGNRPLADVDCSGCRAVTLAWPFQHRISIGRRSLGGSPIRGGGTFYGGYAQCTCGWTDNVNKALSQGGREWAHEKGIAHLVEMAKEAAA